MDVSERLSELVHRACTKGCRVIVCATDVLNPECGYYAKVEGFGGSVTKRHGDPVTAARNAIHYYLYGDN